MVNSIDGMGPLMVRGATGAHTGPVSEVKESFGDILTGMVSQVNEAQLSGDLAIERLQSGDAKHLHEVMIAVEEADVSLRMFVQLRNKALTAYEEIMRMQI
jgi:flagellar hook-basal body complex protein FliE